jgi:hypothetical protein
MVVPLHGLLALVAWLSIVCIIWVARGFVMLCDDVVCGGGVVALRFPGMTKGCGMSIKDVII